MGYTVCLTENGQENLFFTLASRKPTLSDDQFAKIHDFLLENYQVDIKGMKAVRQENCEY